LAIDAERPPKAGGCRPGSVVETQRDDVEGLVGSSRITSSVRRFRILSRCRAKGIRMRTLMRGRLAAGVRPEQSDALRSVALIRIERLCPSGNLTTT
jgi:hypothetical protein